MSDMDAARQKLRHYADALRAAAGKTSDHRVWRSCRELADVLDTLVRFGSHGTGVALPALFHP